jgi:hypothetical protein
MIYLTYYQGVDFAYAIEQLIDTDILTNKSCNIAHRKLSIHECGNEFPMALRIA